METRIRQAVQNVLDSIGAGNAAFAVEWPADPSFGDFAVNAALSASKVASMPPRAIAEQVAKALAEELGDDALSVEIAGPGFVNVTLSPQAIARELEAALDAGNGWGANELRAGQRVMIEYGNPNPFKEMHIGHLVGTVVGESMSRILEHAGATVLRDTFGGDVGPQVAKALWVFLRDGVTDIASAKEIGKAYHQGATAYEESETAKAQIDALNVRIYQVVEAADKPETLSEEDRALFALWQKGREVSMEEFRRLFALLDTKYDYEFFDSDTTAPGMSAVQESVSRGVLEESDGAVIFRGESRGLHTLVFITSRGTPTYETKDVGLAILKEERAPTDEVLILTAVEQAGHFKVVLAALSEILPQLAGKTRHLAHGLLTLTTGKMSSRKGNVITASDLLTDLTEMAAARNADPVIAHQVAVAALKYLILRSAPGGNIVFDPEQSLSLEGDSGPYLQYALVRARAILEKSTVATEAPLFEEPVLLARLISRFPETVKKAQMLEGPHVIAQYLTQLASTWNSYYANERIIGAPDEAQKVALVRAFVRTMERGLWLLGIPAPEKM